MKWNDARSETSHLAFIREVSSVCASLGGPLSKDLNNLLQSGNLRGVVEYDFDYQKGQEYLDYCYARQICALVEKQEHIELGYDKKGKALVSFFEAEEECRKTNLRLERPCPEKDVSAVIHYAMRKISEVLGDIPSLESLEFLFGPGATTNVKGSIANFQKKLSARMACSEEMLPFVGEFLAEFPLWTERVGFGGIFDDTTLVEIDVSYGRLNFVPKNSKTFRPICVEPVLNSLFQKGVGTFLKRRLKRFGVNLTDQSRNQELAKEGSKYGKLCTLDLSNASDTVSLGLVFSLLPLPWANFLAQGRTGKVECEGTVLELEKFSSMGNGYTFELESLIFFGLMSGVISYMRQIGEIGECQMAPLGVYGDDLIIPSNCYELAVRTLSYCGFSPNPKKSFCIGPFRESCGADYFLGNDLRPYYLRKVISDQVLYSFHNWALRRGELEIANLCLRWTRRKFRLWGPDGFGDGHLVGSWVLKVPRRVRRSGWDGGYFHTFVLKPRRDLQNLRCDSLIPSYIAYSGASKEGPVDFSVIRGSSGCMRRKVYTNRRGIFL